MMTTMAAVLGAVPLMLGQGTGSEIRQPLGYAMVGGLLVSQALTLFTTPVVYLYLDRVASGSAGCASRGRRMRSAARRQTHLRRNEPATGPANRQGQAGRGKASACGPVKDEAIGYALLRPIEAGAAARAAQVAHPRLHRSIRGYCRLTSRGARAALSRRG